MISHMNAVLQPALALAPETFIGDIVAGLSVHGIPAAVRSHNHGPIYNWLISLSQLQGISDQTAWSYAGRHGLLSWLDVEIALISAPGCSLLRSYWDFHGCGYSKSAQTCSNSNHLPKCPLPAHPLRKGRLNQCAYSLYLFFRDVCDGDFVTWIDRRLAAADLGSEYSNRARLMRTAVLQPLTHIHGLSNKILSMALADLLLGSDPDRERWVTTGASMIAIDTLVHNFMHRTGILGRASAVHPYGDPCYGKAGCAEILEEFARAVDATTFNPSFPASFPRFIQSAIWRFCAQTHSNVCNGNMIDDSRRCENAHCPAFAKCDRVCLRPHA